MRIALFTENSYKGGLDTYIITLINNWPNSNDEFVLICNKSHPGIDRYESEINPKIDFIGAYPKDVTSYTIYGWKYSKIRDVFWRKVSQLYGIFQSN